MRDATLEALWAATKASEGRFSRGLVAHLPEHARRYFLHTFAEGALLARAARLEMHGEIKLGEAWCPFSATQVIVWERGFVWHAHTRVKGLPVSGSDTEVDGRGAMKWKLLGILPVMSADGPEISRSAVGRLHAEAIWLPGVLLSDEVTWTDTPTGTSFTVSAHGEESHVELGMAPSGGIAILSLARWGDVGHPGSFSYEPFGGLAARPRAFEGVTLATQYRVGWHFGSDRFEREGEFFRCTLDAVTYR